jgi:hypothetical protein
MLQSELIRDYDQGRAERCAQREGEPPCLDAASHRVPNGPKVSRQSVVGCLAQMRLMFFVCVPLDEELAPHCLDLLRGDVVAG